MRGLAKRRPELAAEVRRRDVGDTRERRHVKSFSKRTVHGVASSQHPAVTVLGCARHLCASLRPVKAGMEPTGIEPVAPLSMAGSRFRGLHVYRGDRVVGGQLRKR